MANLLHNKRKPRSDWITDILVFFSILYRNVGSMHLSNYINYTTVHEAHCRALPTRCYLGHLLSYLDLPFKFMNSDISSESFTES